ncbi:esterase-like activity of phytase family protein [Mesonia aquimarina]|uniref:esterase-like activity of phytase family protein n=1 Tax=Mesonia aquimarina TaxID=1504967 RepID=UPI001F093ECB|nr:esterase-like activity of phytase family protein [Mesonia aquimarina]
MLYLKSNLKSFYKFLVCFLFFGTIISCSSQKISTETGYKIQFLDEYIIEKDLQFKNTTIGGLSEIDFDGENFYIACDQPSNPRFYKAKISIKEKKIDTLIFSEVIKLNKKSAPKNVLDLEGIRFKPSTKSFTLSSEGSINNGVNASIFQVDIKGNILKNYNLPDNFLIDENKNPRHNSMFEGLTADFLNDGIWVSTEMPLTTDGPKAKIFGTKSYVRFTHFNASLKPDKQFAYQLSKIKRLPYLPFSLNGLTAILNYDENRFITVERTFAAGRGKKSYKILLFDVNANTASSTLKTDKLKKRKITPAKKQLIFDFDNVRKKLAHKSIDNIEGICFGPILPNGNKTLLLIADNNFNSFQPQLNQLILMEVID